MAKKSSTPSYTVEYALSFDDANPSSVLDKLDKVAIAIYNDVLGEGLKRLHKVQHDSAYASALAEYRKLCRKSNLSKGDIKLKAQLSRIMSDACMHHGFSEYDLHAYVAKAKHHFKDVLGINECQKLATRAFRALEKMKLGKAEKVHFKSTSCDMVSIENKSNKVGIRFDRDELVVRYGKKYKFPIVIKRNDQYAMQALGDRVKYVRLKPRVIRGKKRWFAQLIFEGVPPQKERVYGEDISQGIDIGVSTIAVSNKNEAHLYELAPECATDEKKLRRIERKMDRSKRATNPDNYNPDGTNKTGKQQWKFSNNYKKLKAERAETYRKLAAKRKMSHEALANKIIASGTDIYVEKMQFRGLQKRAKKTTKNKSGRFNSKKRFGKTLSKRAPAMLLTIINRKLNYRNKQLKEVDTFSIKASQYNPLDETYRRKTLKERLDKLAEGIVVQRDMLSAFVLEHVESDLKTINKQQCKQDFERFKYLQDIEVNQLKEKGQLTWYIS